MEEIKNKVEQKISDIKQMLDHNVIVKMRDINGVHEVKDIIKGHEILIILYKDGSAIFLTYKQFLEKKIFFEG